MQRGMTLLVLLVVVLAACTTSTPEPVPTTSGPPSEPAPTVSPSPTTPAPGRMAVVLAPEPALTAAAAEIGVRNLARRLGDEAELRVVTADDVSFVEDLATFFATEGYDLVCLAGAGAERAVRRVAPTAPATRFCVTPSAATDLPTNVLAIDVRVQELGYVAGVALAADGVAGPVGLLGSSATFEPPRVRAGLEAGLAAGGAAGTSIQVVGPLDDEEATDVAVRDLLEVGADGMLALAGALDGTVRDIVVDQPVVEPTTPATEGGTASPTEPAATGTPSPTATPTESEPRFAGLVGGPDVRPEDDGADLSELVLAVLELHLEEAVAVAVERHLGEWDVAPASVGLAEGAFRVDLGTSPRARSVAQRVEDVVTAIRDGTLEVPAG